MSVTENYSYHFLGRGGGLLVELQCHVNQNKIAVKQLVSLLGENVCFFSGIVLKSLKSSLFDIFRTSSI